MNRVRMWMGLSTCAGLLVGIVGCPSPEPAKPTAVPPPATVMSKYELDTLRAEYTRRLHPHQAPEIIDGPTRELVLVGFHTDPPRAVEVVRDLKHELRRRVNDRKARIIEESGGDWTFHIRYENDRVKGSIRCELRPHSNNERDNWDLFLKVNEERR